ncbi:hypothetical protein BGW38_004426 [Lunasporangiospora selenospora]|uniref:Uncharacterized protein n=1 Tax=Lunasporangiospora selenospora TaxID=979761 RepID=A0A9P6G0T4_9FUNG|nr:hypothetical protein BGW38_004426 [Lunasporangiospora selenospora]
MANITASPPSMATNQHPNYTPSLEMQDQGNSPSNVYVIGGGIGGGVIAAIAAVLFIFWRRKKYHAHKKTRKRDSHDSDSLYFKPPSRKYDRHAMKPRYAGSVGYDHDDDDDYVDSVSHRNYKNSHDEEPRRPQRYNDALHEEEIQSFSPTPLDFYNAAAAATATHGITPSSAAESASTVVDECIPIADRQFPRRVMSPAASSTVLAHSVAIRGGQGCEDLVQQGHRAIGRDMNHRGPEQYPRGYPNEFSDYQENSRNPQAMVFYNSPQQMPDTIMATPEELGMYYNQALKDPQDPQFHPQPLNTPQEGSRSNWIRGLHHYQQVPQHTPGPERFNPRDPSHMRQRDELAALKGMHQKQTELQQRMLEQLRLEQEAEMENVRRRYHLNQNSFGKALDEVQALVPPTPVAFSAVKSMNRFS